MWNPSGAAYAGCFDRVHDLADEKGVETDEPGRKADGSRNWSLYVCQMLYALAELFTLTPGNHQVLLIPLLETLGYMDYGRVVEALFMYGLMVSIYRHQSVSGWG